MMNGFRLRRGVRRAMLAFFLAVVLLSLILPAPMAHALLDEQKRDDGPADATGAGPTAQTMGIYITSLRDFDVSDDSFGVDYWLWSVHPPETDPLGHVEFVNAKQVDIRLDRVAERSEGSWSRQKVRATVLHDWDLSDFPFDRQDLQIELRLADPDALAYRPDGAESGYGRDVAPEGWRVTDFEIEERAEEYATTFGEPEASGSSIQHYFLVTLQVERHSAAGFFKMIAGVYAAVALACLSFLMTPDQATVFSGRITLLAAALFAVVVNLQVSDAMLGSLEEIALVHKIHILAMAYVFVAALLSIVSRRRCDSGQVKRAKRWDLVGLCVFSVSFAVFNLVLITSAAFAG
jgi:hypothetical protein